MKLKLISPKGIEVQAQTTHFGTVRVPSEAGFERYETAPVLKVGTTLLGYLDHSKTLASSIAISASDKGGVGIVYVSADDELAALIVDLGEPEVKEWLGRSRQAGTVSLLLSSEDVDGLLMLPFSEQFEELANTMPAAPTTFEQLQSTLTVVFELFDDEDLRARYCNLTSKVVRTASVSLVVPTPGAHESVLH